MATATQTVVSEDNDGELLPGRRSDYQCECGHSLRVSGGGRHSVYFEPENTRLDDPVMNRVCPACGRGLPGKNRP
jgi:hypothetical protein